MHGNEGYKTCTGGMHVCSDNRLLAYNFCEVAEYNLAYVNTHLIMTSLWYDAWSVFIGFSLLQCIYMLYVNFQSENNYEQ